MTEKKTFKNPYDISKGIDELGWGPDNYQEVIWVDETQSGATVSFPTEEWDMEVTFTKKPEPIKVGDTVKFLTGAYQAKVLMIADNDDVWLEFADQSHTTAELSELKHAS